VAQQIGLPGIPYFPDNGGLPNFTITGLTSFGGAGFKPSVEVENLVHFIDTLSVIKGRNTLKFGAEYKPMVNFSILQPAYARGQFNFTGNFTRDPNNQPGTGLGFADFLIGHLDNSKVNNDVDDTFQQPGYFFYAQDDLKLTPKLALNLGIRYEFVSKPE